MQASAMRCRRQHLMLVLVTCVTLSTATTVMPQNTLETSFIAENNAAMAKMMSGMHIEPSGNIDNDFATMMIAHHQGAIDMAKAELRFGSNEQLRRIAQGIVVEQHQEIVAMRSLIAKP